MKEFFGKYNLRASKNAQYATSLPIKENCQVQMESQLPGFWSFHNFGVWKSIARRYSTLPILSIPWSQGSKIMKELVGLLSTPCLYYFIASKPVDYEAQNWNEKSAHIFTSKDWLWLLLQVFCNLDSLSNGPLDLEKRSLGDFLWIPVPWLFFNIS